MTPAPAPPPSINAVHLDELGDLIAGIPGLLGFPPTNSLVLITFTPAATLGPTIRVDLPDPAGRSDLLHQLGLALEQNHVVAVAAIIVGGVGPDPFTLPHRELVDLLADTVPEFGLALVHAIWVPHIDRAVTWRCYADEECSGQVKDPRVSAVAAMRAVHGSVLFSSRAEMEGLLAPDREDRVAHRAQLLAAFSAPDPTALHRELLATIESAADARTFPDDLTDDQIVRFAVALSYPEIRESCLALAISDRAPAAERLWTALARAAPTPERAEPAFLLALHAYLRGAAILAGMALTVALEASPDHELAALLQSAIDGGTPPHVIHWMIAESIRQAIAPTDQET